MSSIRQQKVASLIQRELANYFLLHTKDLFYGSMISVTIVRITPDLEIAKVYVSIFGGNKPKDVVFSTIEQHQKEIKHYFARQTKGQMRMVPEFIFILDDSIEYANEIERLLKKK